MVKGLTWRVVPEDEASTHWDSWLEEFSDHHIRQSFSWACYKKGGWQPQFTALFNGPTPLAMGLCLVKNAPFKAATVLWMNGGPVFRKKRPYEQDLSALSDYLKGLQDHAASFPRPLLRLNMETSMDVNAQLILRQNGLLRPLAPINTGLTYFVDLTQSLEAIRENLERNWRNQLKKAETASPDVTAGRSQAVLNRYLPIHNFLCERKNLSAQKIALPDLERMADNLGERVTFFILSSQNRDGCGGALWTFGKKGWFAFSSSNDWGLKLNLPNAMYWHAIQFLKDQGITSLDLTGIDPDKNWGVFNFKRGLNTAAVELTGEWEWSKSGWLRRCFNAALWMRGGRL